MLRKKRLGRNRGELPYSRTLEGGQGGLGRADDRTNGRSASDTSTSVDSRIRQALDTLNPNAQAAVVLAQQEAARTGALQYATGNPDAASTGAGITVPGVPTPARTSTTVTPPKTPPAKVPVTPIPFTPPAKGGKTVTVGTVKTAAPDTDGARRVPGTPFLVPSGVEVQTVRLVSAAPAPGAPPATTLPTILPPRK